MVIKEKEQGFFGSLALSHKVMAAIQAMGFEEPSPIQAKTIPPIMEGNDVIGQAQTGTGKTAAFGIPIVEKVQDLRQVQALIMTPAVAVAAKLGITRVETSEFRAPLTPAGVVVTIIEPHAVAAVPLKHRDRKQMRREFLRRQRRAGARR